MKLTQITPSLHRLDSNNIRIYFSYETPIAFYDKFGGVWYVSHNVWTRTTGKHLALIKRSHEDHQEVANAEFLRMLNTLT